MGFIMADDLNEKLLKEYTEKETLYGEFAFLVRNLLKVFLDGQGFKFQISHRVKEKCKLIEKIDRKNQEGKQYSKLDEIEDLAGVRVVFYLESDKKRFLSLFLSEFNDCIISQEEKYTPKGYRGFHIIFRLDDKRLVLVEYQKYKGLKCELQISTILFHAWSEVEHDIIYKPKGDPVLLRTLGLDELEKTFEKLMVEHIQAATIQLDYINKKYEEIRRAGEILSADFVNDVINSKTNDEIYGKLEVIEKFYYKKPDETLAIIKVALNHKPLKPVIIHQFKDGFLYGKKHEDVTLKCIELLSSIRYYKPDEVLDLLSALSLSDDKDIKNKALDVVKQFSKYNFNVLTKSKIGYSVQRKALDYILLWSLEKQISNFDFIEIVTNELLSSSVEGTTSGLNEEADYTVTMHFGAIQPTEFIKKIRRETIDLVFNLFQNIPDEEKKLKLVKILEQLVRTPNNVAYGDDLTQMITDDAQYLLIIYRKMLFDESSKIIGSIPVAEEIEKRLYWFHKSGRLNTTEAQKLREDILADSFYSIFRLFAGDDIIFREEEGWDKADAKRSKDIDTKIEEINDSNLAEWINTLNKIAEQIGLVAEWQFGYLKIFLRKLAANKPDIASIILNNAIDNNKPIKNLATNFLNGFRDTNRLDLWDAVIEKMIKKQESNLVSAIIYSLNINREGVDLLKEIRDQDLIILENIVKQTGKFAFLADQKENNWVLQHAIINTLARNFKRDPARIENLIIEIIKRNQERKDFLISELALGIRRGWIDFSEFSKDGIDLIKSSLVELDNLDWDVQGLLLNISKNDVRIIFDVFWSRIEKDKKKKESRKTLDELGHYEAIPYHFNDNLKKYLSTNPQFQALIEEWLNKVTLTWSSYNWNISHFLKEIDNSLSVVLKNMIERGDENSLTKAVQLMDWLEGGDIELGIEVIRRTHDKKNISHIEGMLFSTGVVSGEDGIARTYEAKAEILKKYLNDENEQVKKFAEKMIKSLEDSAKRERQRNEEEKQLRKIEFED
jgi:ppGpp synthetase/RelA/SpoT-type nucleotidyltranferase